MRSSGNFRAEKWSRARIRARRSHESCRNFLYRPESVTRLIFFHVTEFTGVIENLDFNALAWEPKANLPAYDFLEGDIDFVNRLAAS